MNSSSIWSPISLLDIILTMSSRELWWTVDRYVHIMYPPVLEMKMVSYNACSVSYLGIHFGFENTCKRKTKLCYKHQFACSQFSIIVQYIYSNILSHGVFVSQLIAYARVCSGYLDFFTRWLLLTSRFLFQGYVKHWFEDVSWTSLWSCAHVFIVCFAAHSSNAPITFSIFWFIVLSLYIGFYDGCHMLGRMG